MNNNDFIINILMPVFSGIMTGLMGYMLRLIKKQNSIRNATADGTRCLLRDRLFDYHDKYVEDGTIPSYALENWNDMYKAYDNLNGNGVVKKMNNEIQNLEIR